MPTAKLTKRKIDAIRKELEGLLEAGDSLRSADGGSPPALKRTFWYDTDIKGFGLKIEPSGAMTWILEYRPGAGGRGASKKRHTLGPLGTLTPDEAREFARDMLVRVHQGEDPAALKAEARAAITMAELCDRYLEEAGKGHIIGKRGSPKKASNLSVDRGRVTRHIKPLVGNRKARDITPADVERFLHDVANGKTATDVKTGKRGRAIVTGGRGTATRTVRLMGGIFAFAIKLGVRADNPTHGVHKYADNEGARFLNTDELERLGKALREAETVGLPWRNHEGAPEAKHLPKDASARRTTISPYAAAAIRLLLFTGCRLGEILKLEWKHVDVERGLLRLPDSKTGAKVVVLGAPALQILAALPRVAGCPFVIVGENPQKPRSDLKRPWATITQAAGLEGVRIHDLRHTFAEPGCGCWHGPYHSGSPARACRREDDKPLQPPRGRSVARAANAVGSTLATAMGEAGSDDNVVKFKDAERRGTKEAILCAQCDGLLAAVEATCNSDASPEASIVCRQLIALGALQRR